MVIMVLEGSKKLEGSQCGEIYHGVVTGSMNVALYY